MSDQPEQQRAPKGSPWVAYVPVGLAVVSGVLAVLAMINGDYLNALASTGAASVFVFLHLNRWMLTQRFGDPEFESGRFESPLFFLVGLLAMIGALHFAFA